MHKHTHNDCSRNWVLILVRVEIPWEEAFSFSFLPRDGAAILSSDEPHPPKRRLGWGWGWGGVKVQRQGQVLFNEKILSRQGNRLSDETRWFRSKMWIIAREISHKPHPQPRLQHPSACASVPPLSATG